MGEGLPWARPCLVVASLILRAQTKLCPDALTLQMKKLGYRERLGVPVGLCWTGVPVTSAESPFPPDIKSPRA